MLVIGHRGAKGLAPENTLSSLQMAVSEGVDMIEMDLRKRKDGVIILCHNHDKTGEYKNFPELKEALQIVNIPVNLELKEVGLEDRVLATIKNFPHKVLISSSLVEALEKVRALDGNIQLGLVINKKRAYLFLKIQQLAKKLNLYSIHPILSLVNNLTVARLKRTGLPIYVWTVNRKKVMNRLMNLKIDGIFTDYPNRIKK